MWCPRCQCHILAVKNTHPARNTAAVLAMPLTGGLSLAGAGVSDWNCPSCGAPARKATSRDVDAVFLLPVQEEVSEAEPKKARTPSVSRTFQPDSARDAEAAQLVRRQIDDQGGEAEKPVSYLFFRFGVQKRVPGVCKYIGDCLADADIEVTPSLDDGTASNATVLLVLGAEKAEADEPEAERGADLAGDLERLSSLFRDGLLTEDEFNSAKRRVLDS